LLSVAAASGRFLLISRNVSILPYGFFLWQQSSSLPWHWQ
jgi:hypothetical protein